MSSAIQLGFDALERTAEHHHYLLQRLIPVARKVAARGPCTVGDVRLEAVKQGLLPEVGTKRSLSFLGALMREAGLVHTGMYRRSTVEATHGNLAVVWRLP